MAMPRWLFTSAGKVIVLNLSYWQGNNTVKKRPRALLETALQQAQEITPCPLLLRLDGGNDALEAIDVVLEHNQRNPQQAAVDCLIKWK